MNELIQKKLAAVHEQYKLSLPEKIKKIELDWQALRNRWDVIKLTSLHKEVLNLCGSVIPPFLADIKSRDLSSH